LKSHRFKSVEMVYCAQLSTNDTASHTSTNRSS
jgi:hypothetical protein